MDRRINNLIGRLFLLYGGILIFSLLFIESVEKSQSHFVKFVMLSVIVVYLIILAIHVLEIYLPEGNKNKKFFMSNFYLKVELFWIIGFGTGGFVQFVYSIAN